MINLIKLGKQLKERGCSNPVEHIRVMRANPCTHTSGTVPYGCAIYHPGDAPWPRCNQCGRSMTPADYIVGPVCLDCCRANHKAAVGR